MYSFDYSLYTGGVVNWSKYFDHVYCIHTDVINTNNIKELTDIGLYNNDVFSFYYYNTNIKFANYKFFKKQAYLEVFKDAQAHNYNRIFVFSDDVKFLKNTLITEIFDENKFILFSNNITVVNSGDICENAYIINKDVIKYLSNIINNETDNWWGNLIACVQYEFNIAKLPTAICYTKIDYVITYVNNTDKDWQNEYIKYNSSNNININNYKYRDWNILQYQLKSIAKYASWINNVFLVVSSKTQIPTWVNINSVNIVEHKDFINESYLPLFNSRAIEMFLWNIPNLSEYFLYANDDMLIYNCVDRTDFFIDGKIKLMLSNIKTNQTSKYINICKRSFDFAGKEFNKDFKNNTIVDNKYKKLFHIPHSMIRSSGVHLYNIYSNIINNSITKFRCDFNYNQYLYVLYEYFLGNYELIVYDRKYIEIDADITTKLNDISENTQFLCINDKEDTNNNSDFINIKAKLINSLDKKYREVCKYELEYVDKKTINNEINYNITDDTIIVSMTSYPARIKYVKPVLESLVNQDIDNLLYHIVLVLAEPEFPNKNFDLPIDLVQYIIAHSNLIEIVWYPSNIRSHKKLMPTLKLYPNNPILICDDDVVRPQEWLRIFIDDHKKYPNDIIFGVSSWYFGNNYKLKRFSQFKCIKSGAINNLPLQIFKTAKPANGLGGVLYPPKTFTDPRFFDEDLMMKLSPTSDESWQYCFNIIENKTIRQTSKIIDYSIYFLDGTQEIETSLHKVNNYTVINNTLFTEFPEFKKMLNVRMKEFIVSLTSHGARVKHLIKTLNSLFNQTLKAKKIVLTLHNEDVAEITLELENFIKTHNIDLIICDKKIGPHTKYFYAMQKYRNYAVITVDDDHEYTEDLFESLWKSYINNPNLISARRVHLIKRDEEGNLLSYNQWGYNYKKELSPSFDLFPTGVGGVLYPPDIFHLSDDNLPDIYRCLYADDIYLKWLENKMGIQTIWVKNNNPEGIRLKDKEILDCALYKANAHNKEGENRNDTYLKIFNI